MQNPVSHEETGFFLFKVPYNAHSMKRTQVLSLLKKAIAAHQSGSLDAAKSLYRRVLTLDPRNADAYGNLGSVLRQQGEIDAAITLLEHATSLLPADKAPFYNLGNALREAGRTAEAIAAYRLAVAHSPRHAMVHYNLGLTLAECGRKDEARAAYADAIAVDPAHFDARLNLGALLESDGELTEAISHYRAAIALQPARAAAYNNLGLALQNAGRFDEALRIEQQALALEPALDRVASNILMTLQYHPGVSDAALLETARSYGQRFLPPPALPRPPLNGRPLRVGYVSADLYSHPVGFFLQDVVTRHDPARITAYCYSNSTQRDEVTARLASASQWRWIAGVDNDTILRQISEDAIDVLVDLSGHTSGNCLPLFARRAAPLQVSWLGYFATTGVPAIDAVLMDWHHVPAGNEAFFSEPVVRLPHTRFCYSPAPFAPEVSPPPCRARGHITFGSFNSTAKINQRVVAVWSEILKRLPGSRLILKWRTLVDTDFRNDLLKRFAAHGVDARRIELRGQSVHRQLLEEYGDVDIALDPFPFSGGHTSCEALWMGLPIVTLPGTRPVSRQTLCFLANIGLDAWAAKSEEDYVATALALASDPDRLSTLRGELRDRLRRSPLMDAPAFTKNLEDTLRRLWCADALAGDDADALHQAAIERLQAGDVEQARRLLERAIALSPGVAIYHANLGVILKRLGLLDERIACYRLAAQLAPGEAVNLANLAAALNEKGHYADSEAQSRAALRLAPQRPETWHNLGNALTGQARWSEAAAAYEMALTHQPNWNIALLAAAQSYHNAGQAIKAAQRYQQLLVNGDCAVAGITVETLCHRLGNILAGIGQAEQAEVHYRRALALLPADPALLTDLGNALKTQGKHDEAVLCYQQVADALPEMAAGPGNLGTIAHTQGRYDEAIAYYRTALSRDPSLVPIWSNLGNCLSYSPGHSASEALSAFRDFDRLVAAPLLDSRPHGNSRDPGRRLKIGYVSPDFRKHAVAYFALPLIERHRRETVDLYCYYNHLQHDEWTARFKACAGHWIDCAGIDDDALAERIRADEIDILVDLAGHTENNRLLTFARKPAPVQVTWMGYVTTTGLSAMDWRITHRDADPEDSEHNYSEKLWRLPGTMWCYRPLPEMPEVSSAPLQRKGHITFGSFNRFSKNSPLVLETWAAILRRVDNSALLICVPEGSVREDMLAFFSERGIAASRITCFAKVSHPKFWALHGEVDIALDPFPFGGGTTTCETLWLGVPLVTCTGSEGGDFAPRFASRMGYAFLNNLGLPELAAESTADYIDIAVGLAGDSERLATLRRTLRPRMTAAPLTDEARFVREMEDAYRAMWQTWCAQPT